MQQIDLLSRLSCRLLWKTHHILSMAIRSSDKRDLSSCTCPASPKSFLQFSRNTIYASTYWIGWQYSVMRTPRAHQPHKNPSHLSAGSRLSTVVIQTCIPRTQLAPSRHGYSYCVRMLLSASRSWHDRCGGGLGCFHLWGCDRLDLARTFLQSSRAGVAPTIPSLVIT